MMKSSNPLNVIQNMPNGSSVLQLIQGKDPKMVFYEECEKRGVDPNLIINQLQNIK